MGSAVLEREVEGVLRVAWGLFEAGPEVLESRRVDSRVVALECREPHADRSRPEQLGER